MINYNKKIGAALIFLGLLNFASIHSMFVSRARVYDKCRIYGIRKIALAQEQENKMNNQDAQSSHEKQRKPNQYLNPGLVMELAKKCNEQNAQCEHRIRCYYNGLYWACPNPYDKSRASSLEKQYKNGDFFYKCETFPLSDEDFQDDKNWNS